MKAPAEERIQLQHPNPAKKLGRISLAKYEAIKSALLSALGGEGLTHTELDARVRKLIGESFEGNVSWYLESVKLDLEAKGVLERKKEGGKVLVGRKE